MSNTKKTESDFEQMRCHECGKETGTFYVDTDDNEVLCMDCVTNLPSQEKIDYEEANEDARNLEGKIIGGGRWLSVVCVHCGAEIDYFRFDDDPDDAYTQATELLTKDEEHECEPEELTPSEFVNLLVEGGTTNIA